MLRPSRGNFSAFGRNQLGATLFDLCRQFLFFGGSQVATTFRTCPSDPRIGLGLIGLQASSDVVPHVDVGDIDRDDFECGLRIEPPSQELPWKSVRILKTSSCG